MIAEESRQEVRKTDERQVEQWERRQGRGRKGREKFLCALNNVER